MSEWRARIVDDPMDFQMDRVSILLAEDATEGRRLARPAVITMGPFVDRNVSLDPPPVPFLTLPVSAAAALFDTLAVYFLGTSDVERLRRDLIAERARVDKLIAGIGHLGGQR